MRINFTLVTSLISVNTFQIFAGGLHSWVILDDVMPKKEEFSGLKGVSHDSLMPSPRDNETNNLGNSQMDAASNWIYQVSK